MRKAATRLSQTHCISNNYQTPHAMRRCFGRYGRMSNDSRVRFMVSKATWQKILKAKRSETKAPSAPERGNENVSRAINATPETRNERRRIGWPIPIKEL